jgi:hypothetical protein
LLRSQAGVAITGATLFLLACVVAERRRVAHERTALRRELQHAIAEIKTLRGFIPICASCHKVRDVRGSGRSWSTISTSVPTRPSATASAPRASTAAPRPRRTGRLVELTRS